MVVIAERFRFYKRHQRDSESIAVYLAELRRLAKDCDFKEYLPTALRDQLVCGLNNEALHDQQKILAETELTLDKSVEIAQAFEAAKLEARQLSGGTARKPAWKPTETTFTVTRDARHAPTKQMTLRKYATDVEGGDTPQAVANSRSKSVTSARMWDTLAVYVGRNSDKTSPRRRGRYQAVLVSLLVPGHVPERRGNPSQLIKLKKRKSA